MKKVQFKVTVWIPKGWKVTTLKKAVNKLLEKHFGQSSKAEEVE